MGRVVAAFLLFLGTGACAETPPTVARSPAAPPRVPAKCTACHLAPAEHSLAAERWPAYLKAHQRRLHLTNADESFLHDFLVNVPPTTTGSP
jgi:hypothetical protein